MKTIQGIYKAGYSDYDGLDTYQAIPARNMPVNALEPFLFLNHHGYQEYPANNRGLPFGPHPHKGFETVTFIVEGSLVHKDSTGYSSNITKGGVQWMTAGKGIIHSKTSSKEFMKEGGPVEILQLWVNLPARLKNTPPAYTGLQKEDISTIWLNDKAVGINLVSGSWDGHKAPIQPLMDVLLATITLNAGASLAIPVPADKTVLFYVIRGAVWVNEKEVTMHTLAVFDKEEGTIEINASTDSLLLFGHATPNREPIVAHGPFVMNTQEEIRQAFIEYQQGKMGVWQH